MNSPYLIIDTSTQNIKVAIFANNKCLQHIDSTKYTTKPSAYLVPAIAGMLKNYNINFFDLKFVAVNNGPGYFTSLRMGLTYVKMIQLSLNIPIITINTLDSLALQGITNKVNTKAFFIATFDIGKAGAVVGIYKPDLNLIREQFYLDVDEIKKIDDLVILMAAEKIFVLGNKQDMLQSSQLKIEYIKEIQHPSLDAINILALQKYKDKDFTQHLNTVYVGNYE